MLMQLPGRECSRRRFLLAVNGLYGQNWKAVTESNTTWIAEMSMQEGSLRTDSQKEARLYRTEDAVIL